MGGGGGREGLGLGGQGGCDRRIEVFGKIHTKKSGGGSIWGGGGGSGWGVRVDVNEELKLLWKFKKKKNFFWGGGGRVGGGGGQDGCEQRIEVFVKIKKKRKNWGGGGGGGLSQVGGSG